MLQSWILTASAPFVSVVAAASRGFWGAIDSTGEMFSARSENARLRRELEDSQRELFRLRAEAKQLEAEGRLLAEGSALPHVAAQRSDPSRGTPLRGSVRADRRRIGGGRGAGLAAGGTRAAWWAAS